ncbi:MAG: AAA family ATPase [Verrucomicrobiia bacterium]
MSENARRARAARPPSLDTGPDNHRARCLIATVLNEAGQEWTPKLRQAIARPELFQDGRLRVMAEAINAASANGIIPSSVAIHERLPREHRDLVWSFQPAESLPLSIVETEAETFLENALPVGIETLLGESWQAIKDNPKSAASIARHTVAALERIAGDNIKDGLPPIVDAADFLAQPLVMPPELIAGIVHRGSKLAFGGSSKSFKTWTLLDLALAVSTGADWLGFATAQGKVLFCNFEIQTAVWQQRIAKVARAKGIEIKPGPIQLWNLRGHAADFRQLVPKIIARARAEGFSLIVLDPLYKLFSGSTDENSAGDIAALLNSLEQLAVQSGAAVAYGCHFAKGSAANKEAIDRISGSGVQARDPDSLIVFSKHETPDAFAVEPILRNFPPVEPFTVRWEFPLMVRADELDPAKLKQAAGRKPEHTPGELFELLPADGLTNADFLTAAKEQGISERSFYRMKKDLENGGKILLSKINAKWTPVSSKKTPSLPE